MGLQVNGASTAGPNEIGSRIVRRSLAVVAAFALIAGCSSTAAPHPRGLHRDASEKAIHHDRAQHLPVRIADAELTTSAVNLLDLVTNASAAVLATANTSTQDANAVDPSLVMTHQTFTVNASLWGSLGTGDSFQVAFTGGVVDLPDQDPYLLELDGQPQFNEGSQYLLLLTDTTPSGEYFVFGGSQGRYELVDGLLQAVPGAAEDGSIELQLDGLSLSAVEDLLQSLRPGS